MSAKRTLQSPLIIAPLLTMAIYGVYLTVLGKLPSRIMGSLAPAFHIVALLCLMAAFTTYFTRRRHAPNPIGATIIGLAFGYACGLLSYFITVPLGDWERFYNSVSPLPSFLLAICTGSLLLMSWVPGGLAGAAIALTLRLTKDREAASRPS
jgi:hypothetical protein